MKHNSYLITILLLTIGLSSCYENAPDGRYAPPSSWFGIWVPGNDSSNGIEEYHLLEPWTKDAARLTSISWQSKPGEEAYSRQVREVSLCDIAGEVIWCEKYVSGSAVGDGKYGFAVVKQFSDFTQFTPLMAVSATDDIQANYKGTSAQVAEEIAARVRRLRSKFRVTDSSNAYRKSNLAKLPEPPAGIEQRAQALAEARAKSSSSKLKIFENANGHGKTGIKEIDDIDAPAGGRVPILNKPTIKNWRDATADGGLRFLQGAMRSDEDLAAALLLAGGSELFGYQIQAIKITLQNAAMSPASIKGSEVRIGSGDGGQSYTLIGFCWMNGDKPAFNNSVQMNAQSEAEVFGYFTAPKGFQGTKLSID